MNGIIKERPAWHRYPEETGFSTTKKKIIPRRQWSNVSKAPPPQKKDAFNKDWIFFVVVVKILIIRI